MEKDREQQHAREKGAIFIEMLIGFPIFLLTITFFLAVASYLEQKNTLTAAVNDGVRLAMGRANPLGTPLALWAYNDDTAPTVDKNKILALLVHPSLRGTISSHEAAMTGGPAADGPYCALKGHLQDISDIPSFYVAAPAYIYERMSVSLGSAVRYPCNPYSNTGAGCLRCMFFKSSRYTTAVEGVTTRRPTPREPDLHVNDLKSFDGRYPATIHLSCYYQPERSILSVFFAALKLIHAGSPFSGIVLSADVDLAANW